MAEEKRRDPEAVRAPAPTTAPADPSAGRGGGTPAVPTPPAEDPGAIAGGGTLGRLRRGRCRGARWCGHGLPVAVSREKRGGSAAAASIGGLNVRRRPAA